MVTQTITTCDCNNWGQSAFVAIENPISEGMHADDPAEATQISISINGTRIMSEADLTTAAGAFLKLSTSVRARLLDFQETLGEEQFPRAFTDVLAHTAAIDIFAQQIQNGNGGEAFTWAERQRALQGCTRQLQDLNSILDRVIPGASNAGKKGAAKALKQVYNEKDIPRVQKTLQNYEEVFKRPGMRA